jgi:endonuclease YncB( thermonuclease family)
MSRRHKRLLSLLLTALVLGLALLAQNEQTPEPLAQIDPGLYKVTRFSDGDTITVDMNGRAETVRMIGVDTPETHDPDTPVQCYGAAASAYTKNLIGAQKVRLEADPTNQNRDRYKRLLRYVYLPDGRLLQAEIIKNGYGFAYTSFPFTKKDQFVALEKEAQASSKGLWSNCVVTEKSGRKQTNPASGSL